VAGRYIPLPDSAATELRTVPGDSYGTVPAALPSIRISTMSGSAFPWPGTDKAAAGRAGSVLAPTSVVATRKADNHAQYDRMAG
jgi:hypothetical protein